MNPLAEQGDEKFPLQTCFENHNEETNEEWSLSEIRIADSLNPIDTSHFQGGISYLLVFGKDDQQRKIAKSANFSIRKVEKKIGEDLVEIWEVSLEEIDWIKKIRLLFLRIILSHSLYFHQIPILT